MMQKFYLSGTSFIIVAVMLFIWSYSKREAFEPENEKEDIKGAIEDRLFTTADVDLGTIPYKKLFNAIDEGQRRLEDPRSRNRSGSIANSYWKERGPSNRGGRTRAILIDESDPQRNRIWIGGVSGGLWRTEDITKPNPKWTKLGLYFESLAISDIAQDPNDHNTILVSTGESYTGDVQGAGIFRSTDDGETWSLIPSTVASVFQTVNEIYIHTNGDIYAATAEGGLQRSQDHGETWVKVLGIGINSANSDNFHDFFYNEVSQNFYTSNDNSIYRSATGDLEDWVNIGRGKPGFPNNVQRVEFSVCPSSPDVIYAIGAVGSFSSNTYVSNDGGENWSSRPEPTIFFSYGQAWYDLDIAADPDDCLRIMAAGVGMAQSFSQGTSWRPIATDMHTDNHNITFDPLKPGRVLIGNDGGIWFSENGGNTMVDKSTGYVTTQFYAGAIHPQAGSPYVMGGTQDNNSLIISEHGLSPSKTAWGGDGIYCFIDQTNPDIQIVSSQGGNYGVSLNGGADFFSAFSVDGAFINRSGYDDNAHILYGQVNQSGVNDVDFFRWNANTFQLDLVDIKDQNVIVTAVKADPNIPNRVYFGGQSGMVVRTDNTNFNNSVTGTVYADLPGIASVSSIYMDKSSDQDALISLFNFGATLENIWITNDDGHSWNSIEGDLPDLPVRWAIFDPADHDRAMIATDAGIWSTDDINGDQTHWDPPNPSRGMPFVRVDMLLMRESDKIVLAATYGRGLMTSDIFAAPAAVIVTQPIAYVGQPFVVDGTQSVNGQHFDWDMGDNTSSSEPVFNHSYTSPGIYTITLTINGSVSQTKSITVLPYLPVPFKPGEADYSGDFETHQTYFAADAKQGSVFELGSSTIGGKSGTVSGSSAWVLDIDELKYQNNSDAALYTPLFDFTTQDLYQLKFWTRFNIEAENDGFLVEYSLDGGATWKQLGNVDDPNWYNYRNDNLIVGAFPVGSSYFTKSQPQWTQYIKDVSFLAGNPKVCFRYVFRSNYEFQGSGLAIDNFELIKYDGELKTTITNFNAGYTGDQDITVNWATGIEYHCQKFILERSFNGLDFSPVADEPADGVVSTFAHEYSRIDKSLRKVIYYRLKVINENPAIHYSNTFYSQTIVVRRDLDADVVYRVLTNPFTDRIDIIFSSILQQQTKIRLFDASGRLLKDEIAVPDNVVYSLDRLDLIPGIYILSVQIGEEEPTTYKLFTAGN
jgi:hypothetical protein